jgi:DNA-binding beta-propeller fold protein YncE
VIGTIAGPDIQGPWDMTAVGHGDMTTLFVSNALNGGAVKGKSVIDNSTVLRIRLQSSHTQPPKLLSQQVVGDRIPWRDDPAALVIGPTGVALASDGTLYVADTLDNPISTITQAMTRTTPAHDGGTTVTRGQHLKQPLGLILAPNGDGRIAFRAGDSSGEGRYLLRR